MKRRRFVHIFGIQLMSAPLVATTGRLLPGFVTWQGWLGQVTESCGIEKVASVFCTNDVLGNWIESTATAFKKATSHHYFYGQRQYCFTVFEKYHPVAGLLELAIPVWKRQADGSWKKLTSLSLFDLEALAQACVGLSPEKGNTMGAYLLPVGSTSAGSYSTVQGAVEMISSLDPMGIHTAIRITDKNGIVWQQHFKSAHCLTYKNIVS